jgi:hypothetical protein
MPLVGYDYYAIGESTTMIIDPHFALRIHHQRIADNHDRARRRPTDVLDG